MRRTLLFVDDDPDIRLIALLSLQRDGGWDAESCASGAEALELALTRRVDVVVLDLMMPGLDGAATMLKLRQVPGYADVPVVFLTARSRGSEHARLVGLGAAGVLTKPFDPLDLPRQIERLVVEGGAGCP